MIDATFACAWTDAAADFLSSYTNPNTLRSYTGDLHAWMAWCSERDIDALGATRAQVQAYATWLTAEARLKPASVVHRVHTLGTWYEQLVDDEIAARNPCRRVRLPRIQTDPRDRVWLDRWEMAALIREARRGTPGEHALILLLGVMGMRVGAATAARIEDLGQHACGYRTLHSIGKGSKPTVKAVPVPIWGPVDAAAGGRADGPLLLNHRGRPMDRHTAAKAVARIAARAGIERPVSPHVLRRSYATNLLRAGVPQHIVQDGLDHADPRMTQRYKALGVDIAAQASHAMANLIASAA